MKRSRIRQWWYDVRYNLAVKVNTFSERQSEKMRARLYPAQAIPGRELIKAAALHHGPEGTPATRQFEDLPVEYALPHMVALKSRIEIRLPKIIKDGKLTKDDLWRIGILIAVSASIENNLGHCRRLFCREGFLKDDIRNYSARKKIFKEVRRGIRAMNLSEPETTEALDALRHIKRLLKHRDTVSHFIIKPVLDEKCWVYLSARDRDSLTISGDIGDPMIWNYTIMMTENVDQILHEIEELNAWLAVKTKDWHIRLFRYEKPDIVSD